MPLPDDSALLHSYTPYDPVAARAYYLRTRKLKGRQPGSPPPSGGGQSGSSSSSGSSARAAPVHKPMTLARRKELEAQKAALEKRLDRLKDVLSQLVDAAKARSGVKDTTTKDSPEETAAKNEKAKKDTPLTAKQKSDKAAAAKIQYQKDHGSVSKELQALQKQIVDIRAKIQAAIETARSKSGQQTQTASKGR